MIVAFLKGSERLVEDNKCKINPKREATNKYINTLHKLKYAALKR